MHTLHHAVLGFLAVACASLVAVGAVSADQLDVKFSLD